MNLLKKINHIFFTGIGGIGMSGIAEILLDSGYQVSGSDRQLSEITDYLTKKGAQIYQGHLAENLKDVDLLVYSSAISENNPERQAAGRLNIKQIRRAEMLAEIMKGKYSVAVAGTHGKTTTTALCAQVVIKAKLDPTVVIGGKLKNLQTNARLGGGNIFIAEADEFDRSFLALSPSVSILTTIEADHLDCYEDLADIKRSFIAFANKVPANGYIICCIDDPGIRDIIDHLSGRIISYGLTEDAEFRAINLNFSQSGCSFDIQHNGSDLGNIMIQIPGKHNILNAMAAFILGHHLNIPFVTIKEALEQFRGVDRRFEIKGTINDIMVVDDYAHHPTEVAATIESAKIGWKKHTIVVFQPHLFSRTRDFYKEFTTALSLADEVIIAKIYPAREDPIPGVSAEMIVEYAKEKGYDNFQYIPDKEAIENYLLNQLKPQDMIIVMGAGDIWTIAEDLLLNLKSV
jgi:UDP-N-acetylmuramate--alanine ligase